MAANLARYLAGFLDDSFEVKALKMHDKQRELYDSLNDSGRFNGRFVSASEGLDT